MSFGNFGFSEILIIAMIVLIFFGPRRMPEIGRAVGGALREFRRGLNEIQRELQEAERAAKVDPDVPGAKTGSTASKPSTSESPMSELPTPLAAAMASPSEPHSAAPAETASVEETTDVESEGTEAASEETSDPTEKEEGSERAG